MDATVPPKPRRIAPADAAPARSPFWFGMFQRYASRYMARHVHALRIDRYGYQVSEEDSLAGPLVVVLNHPSWWDPLWGLVLAGRFWPNREHYAPIDTAGLAKYRFLERLGFFGVEPGTARGASTFLRRSLECLSGRGNSLDHGTGAICGPARPSVDLEARRRTPFKTITCGSRVTNGIRISLLG